MIRILQGDCREMLRKLPDKSVHCVVTSPPYFGLRNYGVTGQIGLEPTPEAYVAEMVAVFREVRRVLRKDGTCWLNLGDSYATGAGSGLSMGGKIFGKQNEVIDQGSYPVCQPNRMPLPGLKPKDLIGIPWSVAFALRADGWVLRQEIIWAKPNPMPESVTDRCTKSHEQIFLLSKARWSGDNAPRSMQTSDARWLALLLETEGNIAVRRYTHKRETPQHALQIAVANSDRSILEEAQRLSGCGSILTAKGKNRPVYYLQWTTKEAAGLLWEMYPYLFGKKQQAAIGLMLEARRSNGNKGIRDDIFRKEGRHFFLRREELDLREKMWLAVKCLNRQRPVDLSWLKEPKEGAWVPERYYYDAAAIAEPSITLDPRRPYTSNGTKELDGRSEWRSGEPRDGTDFTTRNKRSVWTIATQPYSEAHFATFPPALIEPCILAGCPAKCCAKCGAPWVREVEIEREKDPNRHTGRAALGCEDRQDADMPRMLRNATTLGFSPSCSCDAGTVAGTVLDPFLGAGTSALVADRLGRNCIGIELNSAYAEMARHRVQSDAGMFAMLEAAE